MKRKFLRKLYKAILLLAAGLWMGLGTKGWAFPAATQVPGNGTVATGPTTVVSYTLAGNTATLTGNFSPAAILWGSSGGTLSVANSGPGFNVGQNATLVIQYFTSLLNVDTTGSPSYIMGTISAPGGIPVYVANGSGIIVGSGASITAGGVGLLGYDLSGQAPAFSGTVSVTPSMTTGGAVTIQSEASIDVTSIASGTILVAAPSVNVGVATPTSLSIPILGSLNILSGYSFTNYDVSSGIFAGGPSPIPGTSGSITLSGPTSGFFTNPAGSHLLSSGSITTNGNLVLTAVNVQWGTGNASNLAASNFINNGTITGDFISAAATSGSLVNNGSIIASGSGINITVGGSITNNSSATIGSPGFDTTLNANGGGINNMGTITGNANVILMASNPNHLGPYPAGSIANSGTISIANSSSANTLSITSDPNTGSIFLGGTVSLAGGTIPGSFASFTYAPSGTLFFNTPLTVESTSITGGNVTGPGVLTTSSVTFFVGGNVRNVVSNQAIQNGFHIANGPFSSTAITLDLFGVGPQIINLAVNGNASINSGGTSTFLNKVTSPTTGLTNPVPNAGGNLLVNATGNLTVTAIGEQFPLYNALSTTILHLGPSFIFPGGIALKAGGTLTVNVPIDNGYTAMAGPNFQGIFLSAPVITVNAPFVTSGNTLVHTSVPISPVAVYATTPVSSAYPTIYTAVPSSGKLVVSPFSF